MKEQERQKIISKIDETLNKKSNIFQRIGWKILEFMWKDLGYDRKHQSNNRYY